VEQSLAAVPAGKSTRDSLAQIADPEINATLGHVGSAQRSTHDDDDDPASSVGLPGGSALATSSTVRRRWRRGNSLVHHILDPRTGRSADPVWRTVSVAAQTCFAANTVSTAAIVRGWRALDWIRALGISARLVDSDRMVHTVGGWPVAEPGGRR